MVLYIGSLNIGKIVQVAVYFSIDEHQSPRLGGTFSRRTLCHRRIYDAFSRILYARYVMEEVALSHGRISSAHGCADGKTGLWGGHDKNIFRRGEIHMLVGPSIAFSNHNT